MIYDAIVIGLGAMGSSCIYQLSKTGANILGIDQFSPPHDNGSSHGDTRITRLATGEGSEYVPLVIRSNEIWKDLEKQSGQKLLVQCGGLIMGVHGTQAKHGINDFVKTTLENAKKYKILHKELTANQIKDMFPLFNLVGNEDGYFEPEAGYLKPEVCIDTQLKLAKINKAIIKTNERFISYKSSSGIIDVITSESTYKTNKLILTTGSWIPDLIPDYKGLFKIYRQVLYWFDIKDKSNFNFFKNIPIFIWEFGNGRDDFIYGFPAIDGPNGGVKIASEDYSIETSPKKINRTVSKTEIENMYESYIKLRIPGLDKNCVKVATCLYTVTPYHQFLIDYHPNNDNVIVASPCSGHGFKHSAAVGEVLSQLALENKTELDISKFSFERLLKS